MKSLNYKIPSGLRISFAGSTNAVQPMMNGSFRLQDCDTGTHEVLSYNELIQILKRPGVSTGNMLNSASDGSARIRDGGFYYREQIKQDLREQIDFRLAICMAIDDLEKRGHRVYVALLDREEVQEDIAKFARNIYTEKKIITKRAEKVRGGGVVELAVLPKGKTLFRYWSIRRVRTHNQNITVAARAIADRKTFGHRSYRVETRRQSLSL